MDPLKTIWLPVGFRRIFWGANLLLVSGRVAKTTSGAREGREAPWDSFDCLPSGRERGTSEAGWEAKREVSKVGEFGKLGKLWKTLENHRKTKIRSYTSYWNMGISLGWKRLEGFGVVWRDGVFFLVVLFERFCWCEELSKVRIMHNICKISW